MNYSMLLEEALEERGNAVVVIARPADGADAVIQTANGCFAHMMGRQAHLLTGLRLGALQSVVEQETDWSTLITAMRTLTPLQLDIRLRVLDRQTWLGFGLTFKTDPRENASYAILIGRDITQARRRTLQDNESQRLLASVFLRTSAPVVIVRANGAILMSNAAFQHLVGYSAEEAANLTVNALTPAEYAPMATQARARQLREGGSYELAFDTLTKSGARVPVLLTSVLLRDTQQDLRVVTLLPYLVNPRVPAAVTLAAAPDLTLARSVGQVQAISLAAFKAVFGDEWQRLASRAMMLAEQVIKRRLAPADVYNRSDDHGFVIWFDCPDEDRNIAVLDKAVREVRLRFLQEFGEAAAQTICAHVTARVMVQDTAAGVGIAGTAGLSGGHDAPRPAPLATQQFRAKRDAGAEAIVLHDTRDAVRSHDNADSRFVPWPSSHV